MMPHLGINIAERKCVEMEGDIFVIVVVLPIVLNSVKLFLGAGIINICKIAEKMIMDCIRCGKIGASEIAYALRNCNSCNVPYRLKSTCGNGLYAGSHDYKSRVCAQKRKACKTIRTYCDHIAEYHIEATVADGVEGCGQGNVVVSAFRADIIAKLGDSLVYFKTAEM